MTETILQAAAAQIAGVGDQCAVGCVVGVEIDGERTVAVAGNTSTTRAADAMSRATLHDVASVSKVVATTTALHRLASENQLDFDDEVSRFIPGFGGARDTTVRDLLRHRAGLWEWQPLYLTPEATDDPFRTIDALPLRYSPGHERHYSDLGFMTLGRLISTITGESLDKAVQSLVTEPLGLSHFGYGPVSSQVSTSSFGDAAEERMVRTSDPYPVSWSDAGFAWRTAPVRGTANDGNCAHAFDGVAGHAGIFSTVDSLLDVGATLSRANDHPQLFLPEVTAEVFAEGPDSGQALGWRRTSLTVNGAPLPLLWHPGFTGAALAFVPDRGITAAFACNRLLATTPSPTDAHWQHVLNALATILSNQE
ncbi:serine hydrolase [Salinibacterium sp. M195]|uniref:serine hydrolase domain-containing protein n=1 Tax=Salinibacterium sp. M195 TaxID=2583374 RepID=UPI0021073FD8|nr:serine hydrolase domain-containing protein [Salinibacterium sp. M195]